MILTLATRNVATQLLKCKLTVDIPTKPLHNSDTVSVYFNNFYCMGICDKLSRQLFRLTYIYI